MRRGGARDSRRGARLADGALIVADARVRVPHRPHLRGGGGGGGGGGGQRTMQGVKRKRGTPRPSSDKVRPPRLEPSPQSEGGSGEQT